MSLAVGEKCEKPVISHDDECSICIESLLSGSNVDESVARVASCQHCYHDLCIRSWSEQANSCPKCRCKFNKVELIDRFGNLIYDYAVRDKQFPVDPNYLAPREDDEDMAEEQEVSALFSRAAAGARGDRFVPGASAVSRLLPFAISCALCSSSSTTSNVNVCQSCSCSFHPGCLGMSDTYVGYWNCPMCDCLQQSLSSLVSSASGAARTRRSRQSIRTDATYARLTRASRRQQQHQGRTRSRNAGGGGSGSSSSSGSSSTHAALPPPPGSPSSAAASALSSPESTPAAPSREEEEAWRQFEMFRKNPSRAENVRARKPTAPARSSDSASVADTASSSNSARAGGSPNSAAATKKLKRPSRRGKSGVPGTSKAQQPSKVDKGGLPRQQIAPASQSASSGASLPPAPMPGGGSSSRVMTLLTEMHTNSQTLLRDSSRNNAYRNYEPQRLYGQLSPPLSPDYRQTRMLDDDVSDVGKEKVPLSE